MFFEPFVDLVKTKMAAKKYRLIVFPKEN